VSLVIKKRFINLCHRLLLLMVHGVSSRGESRLFDLTEFLQPGLSPQLAAGEPDASGISPRIYRIQWAPRCADTDSSVRECRIPGHL
jgi:hypothetical protein